MKELTIIQENGQLLVDSREVAEMVGKQHKNLLRDIDGYVEILLGSKLSSAEFFIESSYKDSTGRTLKCYLLTKKGCDMVANKMTGEKGILFTAAYVSQFEAMEKALKNQPVTIEDAVIYSMQELKTIKQKQLEHGYELSKLRLVVDNEVWLTEHQKQELRETVNSRIYTLNREEYDTHYQALYGALKRHFGVAKYDKIPRKHFETAKKFVDGWYPPKRQTSMGL